MACLARIVYLPSAQRRTVHCHYRVHLIGFWVLALCAGFTVLMYEFFFIAFMCLSRSFCTRLLFYPPKLLFYRRMFYVRHFKNCFCFIYSTESRNRVVNCVKSIDDRKSMVLLNDKSYYSLIRPIDCEHWACE